MVGIYWFCYPGSLDSTLVNGTIALCDLLNDGEGALGAGAIGTIMRDSGFEDVAFSFPLSTSYITLSDGSSVPAYSNSTGKPTATILKSTEIKDRLAPFVVSFSSRGPNPITSDILKPDWTAPGVDIVAAWSLATTMTGIEGDTRVVPYNIISGTSMSCPHATGAAAYVKSFHPTWSPAAIKSALMTTATPLSSITNSDVEFAYGSGHINPLKAANPANNGTVWDLNYPSFALSANTSVIRDFHRTVTNVGLPVSTYKATVVAPPGLNIQVEPSVLSFKSIGQKISFVVTIATTLSNDMLSGSLVWDDGVYQVRSPIVAYSSS
ncbi:unnamed protein product [Ilex paraguariensis]|uniref:Cucumisin n=1 Tax=Ilex paraguariensis TaxID=185542 RepID=A0ABC8TQR5_9AQUA